MTIVETKTFKRVIGKDGVIHLNREVTIELSDFINTGFTAKYFDKLYYVSSCTEPKELWCYGNLEPNVSLSNALALFHQSMYNTLVYYQRMLDYPELMTSQQEKILNNLISPSKK